MVFAHKETLQTTTAIVKIEVVGGEGENEEVEA